MRIKIKKVYPGLRAHTIINGNIIASDGYKIFKIPNYMGTKEKIVTVPGQFIKKNLSKSRILSRGFRLGISQIKKIFDDKILIFCNKNLILSDIHFSEFEYIDIPIKSFQLMDHNICATDDCVYYSEYFPNKPRNKVHVYQSENGIDWKTIYEFPAKSIRHIHTLQEDPYERKIWFSTGDLNSESMVGFANYNFTKLKILGKGGEKWKTLEFHFTKDKVYWGMDSGITSNFLIEYDRNRGKTKLMQNFGGSIFNLKKINKGIYLVGTAVEGGYGETDKRAHIWLSTDLHHWEDLISYNKDIFPYKLGYGRLIFPEEMENSIIFSGQGVKDIDNKLIMGEVV